MNLKPGMRLRHYEIESVIGRGGMGVVYKARDTQLNRDVAIKVLYANLAGQEEYVKRFFREAQAVARIDHPNVVKIYEVGQEEDICFIVMEYIDGLPLSEMLESSTPLPIAETVDIAVQVASGLECTHEQEVLHRDIKSGNIMVTRDGVAKLLDFGLARIEGVSALTLTGNVMGTLDYIAPEQVLNEPVDQRSDLYSFGVVLYEMLAGRRPFDGDEAIAVVYQHINDNPVPPSSYHEEVPSELDHLVMALLAKRAPDRYQSAAALLSDLRAYRDQAQDKTAFQTRIIPEQELQPALHRLGMPHPRDEYRHILAGRDAEVAQLKQAVQQAMEGNGQLTLLAGGVGAGKTRLVMEAMAFASSQRMLTLFGSCLYEDMSIPYQPFVEALSQCLASSQSVMSPVARARLRKRILDETPEVAELMPHIWTAQERQRLEEQQLVPLGAQAQQQRLFQSILHLMLSLADEYGVMLCMDDLHWGDSGSVQLLHYLARQLPGKRLHLIVTHRPAGLEPADVTAEAPFTETLNRLNREGLGETITLNNLKPEHVRTIVETVLEDPAVSVTLSDRLYQETDGNPLFVHELLKWWQETGRLDSRDQAWVSLEHVDTGGRDLPPRIYEMIARRLNRLEDSERELLEVAAVGGTRFDVDSLAAILGTGRVGVLRQLHMLERKHGIITPVERGIYQFAHGQTREVLYHELPEALRQEYHTEWGRTLLARKQTGVDVPVEVLAAHLYQGGDEAGAMPYLREAAERARKVSTVREARWYWEQIDTVLSRQDEEEVQPSRIEACLRLGWVYFEQGDWDAATERYKEAFGMAQNIKNRQAQAEALMRIGAILFMQNKWEAANQVLNQSIKLYTACENQQGIASVLIYMGLICKNHAQYDAAKQNYNQALKLSKEIDDESLIAIASGNLGFVAMLEGDHETAIHFYEASSAYHKHMGNILGTAQVTNNLGIVHERDENWPEALHCYQKGIELFERMGILRDLGITCVNYARVLARTGDFVLAETMCQKGRHIIKSQGNQHGLAEATRVDGLIASLRDDWEAAERCFKESERLSHETNEPYEVAETYRERAYMLFRRGDVQAAIDAMNQAEQTFQSIGARADVAIVQRKRAEMEASPEKRKQAEQA